MDSAIESLTAQASQVTLASSPPPPTPTPSATTAQAQQQPQQNQDHQDHLKVLWCLNPERAAIEENWVVPMYIYKTRAAERIHAHWEGFDLNKPLFKNRSEDKQQQLRFRYARK